MLALKSSRVLRAILLILRVPIMWVVVLLCVVHRYLCHVCHVPVRTRTSTSTWYRYRVAWGTSSVPGTGVPAVQVPVLQERTCTAYGILPVHTQ